MLNLPKKITVVEVGPRDGLQSLSKWIPTARKVRLVDTLSDAGFPVIEVTSFTSPRVVPNLIDAEKVLAKIKRRPGTIYRVLAPNPRGLERALECEVDEVLALSTVSPEYTRRNQKMSVEESVTQAAQVYRDSIKAGIPALVAVGMAMYCPYEGRIPEENAMAAVQKLYENDVRRIYLAGSLGMEDPRQVGSLIGHVKDSWPDMEVGFHAHDMSGFGAANVFAAIDAGATSVEGSICGVGGGVVLPHALNTAGNLATEDLVHILNCAGVETGIDSMAVLNAAREAEKILGIKSFGRLVNCGTREQVTDYAS